MSWQSSYRPHDFSSGRTWQCLSQAFIVLMARDVDTKHSDRNSGMTTARVRSCVIMSRETSAWSIDWAFLLRFPPNPVRRLRPRYHHGQGLCPAVACDHAVRLVRISYLSFEHLLKPHWAASTSREWTGALSRITSKTGSLEIPL